MQDENMLSMNPYMLLSLINTKLRDEYSNLSLLCDDYNINEQDIKARLKTVGFDYFEDINQFK